VSDLLTQLEDMVSSAANEAGMNSDEVAAKQLQVDSILSTINRIANSTSFEGKKLLNGTLDYNLSSVATSAMAEVNVRSAKLIEGQTRSVTVQVTASAETGHVKFTGAGLGATNNTTLQITGDRGSEILSFAGSAHASAIAAAVNQATELTGVSATMSGTTGLHFNSTGYGSDAFVQVEAISGTFSVTGGTSGLDSGADASVIINGQAATTKGLVASISTEALSVQIVMSSGFGQQTATTKTFGITGGGATFSLSPDVLAGRTSIGIQSVAVGSLGDSTNGYLSSLASGQTNNLSSSNLGTAQEIVKEAVKQVATLRGRLGSFQNLTIESTVKALNVALENTVSAESAIRDTDFALETSNLTRSQILTQAATTVLRQANAAPQNVLALLQ
jgi:flagellin